MPRQKEPPRLYPRKRKDGRDVWIILDGGKQIATGCALEDHEAAQRRLAEYLDEKWSNVEGSHRAEDLTVGKVLAIYAKEHGPEIKAKATLAYSIEALASFWTAKTVSEVKGNVCRRYRAERRRKDGTVRRELGVLQAALNHCATEGYLLAAPKVWLPPAAAPRDRCLTPEEARRLLDEARETPHLYRFIWLGLHTGTRSDAMLRLQWFANKDGGHIDLDSGLMYRKSAMEKETKKRQTPVRLAPEMLEEISTWRPSCRQFVIEWRGDAIRSVKHAFASCCERAGIEGVSPHILRHTAITDAITAGAETSAVSSYFGITLQELERTYLHHSPEHQKSASEAVLRRRNLAGNVAESSEGENVVRLSR